MLSWASMPHSCMLNHARVQKDVFVLYTRGVPVSSYKVPLLIYCLYTEPLGWLCEQSYQGRHIFFSARLSHCQYEGRHLASTSRRARMVFSSDHWRAHVFYWCRRRHTPELLLVSNGPSDVGSSGSSGISQSRQVLPDVRADCASANLLRCLMCCVCLWVSLPYLSRAHTLVEAVDILCLR